MGLELSKGILERIQEKKEKKDQKKRQESLDQFKSRWKQLIEDEGKDKDDAVSIMSDEFSLEEDSVETGLVNIGLVDEDEFEEAVPRFKDRQCNGPKVWDPTDQTCKHPSDLSDQAKQQRSRDYDGTDVDAPDSDPMTPSPETPQGEPPSSVDTDDGEPNMAPDDNLNQKNRQSSDPTTRSNTIEDNDRANWAQKNESRVIRTESVSGAIGAYNEMKDVVNNANSEIEEMMDEIEQITEDTQEEAAEFDEDIATEVAEALEDALSEVEVPISSLESGLSTKDDLEVEYLTGFPRSDRFPYAKAVYDLGEAGEHPVFLGYSLAAEGYDAASDNIHEGGSYGEAGKMKISTVSKKLKLAGVSRDSFIEHGAEIENVELENLDEGLFSIIHEEEVSESGHKLPLSRWAEFTLREGEIVDKF